MKETIIEKYQGWIEFGRLKYPAPLWIGMSAGISAAAGIATFAVTNMLLGQVTLFPLALAIAVLVLLLGYPYMRKESIIDSIEKNFSDALKQMADTLKAGDTYESALREVVDSEYGRLSEEMELALRKLEEGENLESALNGFAERIDSRLVKRTITIILDSIKTGASLAEILDEIADDVRDFQRIKEDRKSNTTMQFMFMIAAGGAIAPLIFGEINSVVGSFSAISGNALGGATTSGVSDAQGFTTILIQIYLIIEVIASGAMMSIIREGKLNKSIIYIPLILLLAFTMYYLSTFVVGGVLGAALV